MGKRSRKRGLADHDHDGGGVPPRVADGVSPAPPRTYRSRRGQAPAPPWAPVPLAEIAILLGLGLLIAGFIGGYSTHRGEAMIAGGLVLVGLASLEVALREHFAGYRSHTSLLAGAVAMLVLVVLALVTAFPRYVSMLIALAVFGVLAYLFRSAFKRRAGVSFRV